MRERRAAAPSRRADELDGRAGLGAVALALQSRCPPAGARFGSPDVMLSVIAYRASLAQRRRRAREGQGLAMGIFDF